MTGRDPPQDHVGLAEPLEPVATMTQHAQMCPTGVHKRSQRLERPPHRHVHDQAIVAKRLNPRCVAVLGLESPNESRRGISGGVNRLKLGNELGKQRRLERLARYRDVGLRDVEGHASHFSHGDLAQP